MIEKSYSVYELQNGSQAQSSKERCPPIHTQLNGRRDKLLFGCSQNIYSKGVGKKSSFHSSASRDKADRISLSSDKK
jgi:hypothetical protein